MATSASKSPKQKVVRLTRAELERIAIARTKTDMKYMDVVTFCRVHDVSHGMAYALITNYPELTVSLPGTGKKRGKRLFIVDRVNALFEKLMAEQHGKEIAK
jgi:hypothetical protein